MNYGYFLIKENQFGTAEIENLFYSNGANCIISDSDNLANDYSNWVALMNFLEEGDKLIVSELNDIFLSIADLNRLFINLKGKGIQFHAIKEDYGFNQKSHDFCDVLTVYEKFKKRFQGTDQKKKGLLSKLNNEPRKIRRNMSEQVTSKAISIGKCYLRGDSVEEIMEEFGFCSSTLYAYLEHIGIKRDRSRFDILPGFEDVFPIIDNIVEMYNQGKSIAKIVLHYPTLNISKIRDILVSQGVGIRNKGRT